MRLMTDITLIPDSTCPVVSVYDSIRSIVIRLFNAVEEHVLAELATVIRQNRPSEQEAGDDGAIEEHSGRHGA